MCECDTATKQKQSISMLTRKYLSFTSSSIFIPYMDAHITLFIIIVRSLCTLNTIYLCKWSDCSVFGSISMFSNRSFILRIKRILPLMPKIIKIANFIEFYWHEMNQKYDFERCDMYVNSAIVVDLLIRNLMAIINAHFGLRIEKEFHCHSVCTPH